MGRLGVGVKAFVLACVGAAIAMAWIAVRVDGTIRWQLILGFGFLCLLAEQFPVPVTSSFYYSVGFVVTIAATVAAGPGEAALANAFGAPKLRDLRETRLVKLAFNAAQFSLSASTGGLVYHFLNGPVGRVSGIFPQVLLPLAACTVTNFLTNSLLVSTVVAMTSGRRAWDVWREQYAALVQGYVAFTFLGLLLGLLQIQMGWGSVLFLLVPLLVARNAFQAAVRMQGAYDATVGSLIRAIEAKDEYTRGHAERVSRLAAMTARELGLGADRVRQVRYAALMHDVGKLVVASKVLKKPDLLSADEYEHMKTHSERGYEIVSDIDLLADVVDGVRHHHEHWDGSGYPAGLEGEQIPLTARIIMVADAFDSMTSTRAYRPAKTEDETLTEMRACAGGQFDPRAVAALERAIAKHGWEPRPMHAPSANRGPRRGREPREAEEAVPLRDRSGRPALRTEA